MKKRVFIIHGWGASPEANWFPWMKTELEKHDFMVSVPQMPHAYFPKQEEWLKHMQETVGAPGENTYFVGHSLGVIAILRYLETLPKSQKIGGAILVSGFSESLGTIAEIENFFEKPVSYGKIKSHCSNFVIIQSDDDPFVPMQKAEILQEELGAKMIMLHGAGHINMGSGHFELPEAVEELLNIAK